MADQTTAADESRLKRRAAGSGIAIFISALVVLILIGFFASHSGIDKKLAEKRLAEWTRAAAEMASAHGYLLTFDKEAIEIEGSLFSKRAAVKNATLMATPESGPAEQARSLTTDVFYLDPDMLGGGLSVIFTEPLLYTTPEGRTRIVSGEAIEMVVEDYKNDSGSGLAYTLLTPPHLSMERLGRQSDAVISTTDISFGPNSKVYGMVDQAKGTYTQEAQLMMVSIKRNDRVLGISSFTSVMETANQNGSLLTHYELSLEGLTTNGPLEPLGAMNASLDVEYEEPALVDGQPLNLSLGRDRNITLEKLLVESSSGKLLAKARLRQMQQELMPFGNATLQIENPVTLLAALQKTSALQNIPDELVKTMMQRIAPEWKGDDSPVTIQLKREPNGPFYIGELTFEEFTAVLLSQLLKQSAPELPLALPPSGEPAAPAGNAQDPVADDEGTNGTAPEDAASDAAPMTQDVPAGTAPEQTAPEAAPAVTPGAMEAPGSAAPAETPGAAAGDATAQ